VIASAQRDKSSPLRAHRVALRLPGRPMPKAALDLSEKSNSFAFSISVSQLLSKVSKN
jgi:hypothetical protein